MESETQAAALSCPICTDTLTSPVIVSCCGHTFCRLCLDQALSYNDACPFCRAPLLAGIDCVLPNRALQDILSSTAHSLAPPIQHNNEQTCIAISTTDSSSLCPPTFENDGPQSTQPSYQLGVGETESGRSPSGSHGERRRRTTIRGIQGTGGGVRTFWDWMSPRALLVKIFLLWGERGRVGLQNVRKVRRWLSVNEPRLRCCFYVFLVAAVMIFLRVQEEDYGAQGLQYRVRPYGP